MTQLIIDYVLEGHQRGYNIVTPKHGLDDDIVKIIWRNAMPRGKNWSAYIGARSIKVFTLPDDQIAVCDVTVTDRTDETGRGGIRRATVDVMTPKVYQHHIESRLMGYPQATMQIAKDKADKLRKTLPRPKKNQSLVLAYPFATRQTWWTMEAIMLALVYEPPRNIKRLLDPLAFTTLALDHRAEAPLIAMPASRAADVDNGLVVYVP